MCQMFVQEKCSSLSQSSTLNNTILLTKCQNFGLWTNGLTYFIETTSMGYLTLPNYLGYASNVCPRKSSSLLHSDCLNGLLCITKLGRLGIKVFVRDEHCSLFHRDYLNGVPYINKLYELSVKCLSKKTL